MNDKARKHSGHSGATDGSADLTCSEGQIEDLLSGGESTETDGEPLQGSKKQGKGKSSPVDLGKQEHK
jgi:hypothetical protein